MLSCAAALLMLGAAPDDPAQDRPAPAPQFGSGVEQVVVDAVVLNERGEAIAGLSREDFLVLEDGAEQALASFEAVDAPPLAASPTARPAPGMPVVSNAPGLAAPPRTFAFVIDDLGLTAVQAERVRAALGAFVQQGGGREQLLLATTSGRDRWSAHTPEERADLLAVLGRVVGRRTPEASNEHLSDTEAFLIHVQRDAETVDRVVQRYRAGGGAVDAGPGSDAAILLLLKGIAENNAAIVYPRAAGRVSAALDLTENVAASLEGAPGRKSIVLVTPGFFYEPGVDGYRHVEQACRRANAAVYVLDVSGLEAMPAGLTAQFGQPFRLPQAERPLSEAESDIASILGGHYAEDFQSSAGSDLVAATTGGAVVRREYELADGLGKIAEDSRAYYFLGYVPTNAAHDGRYRRIAVRLTPKDDPRRADWKVRARRGYYAPTGQEKAADEASADRALRRALDSPFPLTGLPLRLAAYALEDSAKAPGTVRCRLVAEVDVAAVAFREADGRSLARLEAAFEARARDAAEALAVRQQAKLSLAPETRSRLERDGYRLQQDFELPAGAYQTAVAVRDTSSGRVGSVSVRLDVPAAGAFRVSTPVLSGALETDKEGWPHPVPTGRRAFASGSSVYLAFDVHGAARDEKSRRPAVSMGYEVTDAAGDPLLHVNPSPIAPGPSGGLHRFAAFELAGATPGEYRVVGRVRDEIAGRELTFTEPFAVTARVEEPPPAAASPKDAALAAVLEKAGRYVLEYESVFHDIAAEEEYRQRASGGLDAGSWRRTRADVVFARLPPPIPWGSFRDVFELNGQEVRSRDARLEKLFRETPRSAAAMAEAILAESARYNIGPQRTVNLPTLPLLFLHPHNQGRFSYELKKPKDGDESVEVTFRETTRPTIVRDKRIDRGRERGRDLPARGRAWIDPRHGTVLRTEVVFRFGDGDSRATVSTDYRVEPRLTVWVPSEMRERYEGPEFAGITEAAARYTSFRQFQVTTTEGPVQVPPRP